ncbi:hypothetical protein CGRA01v4_05761 [Colletotrichum graminicola]|nr:hypothetical protein CGRA01v4_05761 [Colletotrichum graminicola]
MNSYVQVRLMPKDDLKGRPIYVPREDSRLALHLLTVSSSVEKKSPSRFRFVPRVHCQTKIICPSLPLIPRAAMVQQLG